MSGYKSSRVWIFGLMVLILCLSAAGIRPAQAAKGNPPTTESGTSDSSQLPDGAIWKTPDQQKAAQAQSSPAPTFAASSPEGIIVVPANDDIASATVISPPLPFADAVDTTFATTEAGEPSYSCGYNVDHTVWYSYTPTSDGYFLIDTSGSDYDTVLNVFTDGTATEVGCDDDSGTGNQSLLAVNGDHTKTYLISVGGYNAYSGNLTFNMTSATTFSGCGGAVGVSSAECHGLVRLYNNTNGASWTNSTGWKAINEVCAWYGVRCDSGHVSRIDLSYNNLAGSITKDLTGLSQTTGLYLSGNAITGDIATTIPNLPTSLLYIDFYDNLLTGTIPTSIGNFSGLYTFEVGQNSISGDFASFAGNLPNSIGFLGVYNNNFSGTIPDMTGTNLYSINVINANLDGDIDTIMGNMPTSIHQMYLSDNNFTGTVSTSAAGLTNLQVLYINGNQLDGDLSGLIGNLPTTLTYLLLGYNNLTGNIPSTISNFVNLFRFDIGQNDQLLGTIPLDITSLSLNTFGFTGTYLCEPADAGYTTWASSLPYYYPGYCGYYDADLEIQGVTFSPAHPTPGQAFTATVNVRNVGGAATGGYIAALYDNRTFTSCPDGGDAGQAASSLDPGYTSDVGISVPAGLTEGVHNIQFYVDPTCSVTETYTYNNSWGPIAMNISTYLFQDDFETGDLSQWSSFNDGGGFLTACNQAAMNGSWGACVDRGSNNTRKQLIDQTPADETVFNARFNFDVNSLLMGAGQPLRIMQMKMGSERPVFLVLRYNGSAYQIQLNVKQDDLTKVKTAWITISDAPHTIEVDWAAASTSIANDGSADLYIDDVPAASLTGLDNNSFTIASYRMGMTSRLAGKSITGVFYVDDVATNNTGYIGLP